MKSRFPIENVPSAAPASQLIALLLAMIPVLTLANPEEMQTTLLNMPGTGNTTSVFGLYDGLTFTADGVGSISQFNYTGMPYSEGFVGIMDRNTGTIVPGSQISFGPSGTLSTPFALDADNLYLALFKTTDPFALQTGNLTINRAQIPTDSGFINPQAPIGSVLGTDLVYRGQDQYGTLSINGAQIPEPSITLLNFEATGDTIGGFGNFDGYSFTNNNDQPVVITSFNYQGMPFSGGLIGKSSATNPTFSGSTTLIDMFGTPTVGPITILPGETWTVAFEKSATGPFLSINRAEGPVSGILDSGAPIQGGTSSGFSVRGQDQFSAGSINGYILPAPILITSFEYSPSAVALLATSLNPTKSYRLFRSVDLCDWIPIEDSTFTGASEHTFNDLAPLPDKGFYRVEEVVPADGTE